MKMHTALALLASLTMALAPTLALAQSVSLTRSILPDLPYTIIYPEPMIASGGPGSPIVISHPNAPLRCDLAVVPVEDTAWTAEAALGAFNAAEITAGWSESLPGFALSGQRLAQFQDTTALAYEGTSTGSPMDVPVTLVHAETVTNGRGYALDCVYATDAAAQTRPIVDFIIANFSTRADAECCIGATVEPEPEPDQPGQ